MNDIKDISYIKDTFKIGSSLLDDSRVEAADVWDLYHNNQYTDEQLRTLRARKQPAETFNLIKIYSRLLLGYYSTIINTITVESTNAEGNPNATLLSGIIKHILRDSSFKAEGEKVKLSGVISGLMCVFIKTEPTGETDQFGRPLVEVKVEHVPEDQMVLDPNSRLDDYSDARYQHRSRWVSEDTVAHLFGASKIKHLSAYENDPNSSTGDFIKAKNEQEIGESKRYNKYLVVHTITKSVTGTACETFWCGDIILKQSTYTEEERGIIFPYRVVKVNGQGEHFYYGVFHDVLETQHAINQALVKLQLSVATQKAFVEKGAVDDIGKFTTEMNTFNAVVEVNSLQGVQIENLTREAQEQYRIIDKALDRFQRALGLNDSFLGMAYASDSGDKVQIQQKSAVIAMRYFTGRVEAFYTSLGYDLAKVVGATYTATQTVRLADSLSSERVRMLEINTPELYFEGEVTATGEPVLKPAFNPVFNQDGGHREDEDGNFMYEPITDPSTTLQVSKYDIVLSTEAFDPNDAKDRILIDSLLSGLTGQVLANSNPAAFFKLSSLSVEGMATKHSAQIARLLKEVSQDMEQGSQQVANDSSSGTV